MTTRRELEGDLRAIRLGLILALMPATAIIAHRIAPWCADWAHPLWLGGHWG